VDVSPTFEPLNLSETDEYVLSPFFTNLNNSVFAVTVLPPEVIGALCSRASRAKGDLREIFLNEFIKPFLETNDEYGKSLNEFIDFLHKYPISLIFSNPKGREFYIKWLAQYGDDSIAQMSGIHLIYSSLSLVAIKHFEHMRIGLAPIEKSTRYVDYSTKINGQFRYYTDPVLKEYGLEKEYTKVMDNLFETYSNLISKYYNHLKKSFPNEADSTLKAKSFDTLRGLLPLSTLSQVAFFGNGQSFEYAYNRSIQYPLNEVKWAAISGLIELNKIAPAFFHRSESEIAKEYQYYLGDRSSRIRSAIKDIPNSNTAGKKGVSLLDYDQDGENQVIAGLIYPELHCSYEDAFNQVHTMTIAQKKSLLDSILFDRKARFYKIPRAFELAELTFEVTANWSVWKDLQRHRMVTTINQNFNTHLGYDVPKELIDINLDSEYRSVLDQTNELFLQIEAKDPLVAQYCVTQAHLLSYVQQQNLRSFFWEVELRTGPQGHPDYRRISQEKVKLVQKVYPLLSEYLKVDMNDYDFARREIQQSINQKEASIKNYLQSKGI